MITVPSAISPIQNERVTEGDSVTLSCNASGTPPLMVSWIKVGNHTRTNQNELVLANINRNETGEYRCEASNECGNASETVTIEVQCKCTCTCIERSFSFFVMCAMSWSATYSNSAFIKEHAQKGLVIQEDSF